MATIISIITRMWIMCSCGEVAILGTDELLSFAGLYFPNFCTGAWFAVGIGTGISMRFLTGKKHENGTNSRYILRPEKIYGGGGFLQSHFSAFH